MAVSVGHDIFTDLAFEGGGTLAMMKSRHVFVSSVSGSIYQIDYDAHRLDAVYQLHSAAINSIAINEGFAITGSDDKVLRVWPIDFSDYFLEAEHETPVTAVATSADGLQVMSLLFSRLTKRHCHCSCLTFPVLFSLLWV